MRLRPRWIALLLLILISPKLIHAVRSRQQPVGPPDRIPERLRDQSDKRIVSILGRNQSLAFEIPHGTTHLRLLTNGTIDTKSIALETLASLPERPEWGYAIDYAFEDREREKIDQGVYHFKTRLDVHEDSESGQSFLARYYAEETNSPASTREMNIAIRSMKTTPRRLNIRLRSADPEVIDVAVRILCQVMRPKSERTYTWNRLSRKRRKQLASGSVHSYLLLDDREKQNLLRTIWRPLAPLGYQNVDFQQRTLFTLRDIHEFRVRDERIIGGWRIGSNRRGMLAIPQGSGQLRLEITRIEPLASSTQNAITPMLCVNWFGKRRQERSIETVPLNADMTEWITTIDESPIDDGLMELDSNVPIVVRAFWQPQMVSQQPQMVSQQTQMPQRDDPLETTPQFVEITPEPTFLRTYLATTNEPLDYQIAHVGNHTTSVRAAFRILESTDETFKPINVRWEYLDAMGQVVRSGTLTLDTQCSLFDRVHEKGLDARPSDPADTYFAIPTGITQLRFIALDNPILVAASTRPPDLPKTTAIPEDYTRRPSEALVNRAWHPLRPRDFQHRTDEGRSILLTVQIRPPEIDADMAAGRYQWESFHPNGPWKAFHALLPRKTDMPLRSEAIGSTFSELTVNREFRTRLIPDPGYRTVSPTLIYHFSDATSRIEVFVDGRLQLELVPQTRTGQISISSLLNTSKPRAITVRCDAQVQLWMNRIETVDTKLWRKTLALRFDGQSLEFDYTKIASGPEELVLQVFRTASEKARLRLEVSIEPNHVASTRMISREHTLLHRIFDIAPAEGPHGLLVGAGDKPLIDPGRSCVIPFGSDLPPGNYTVRIQRDQQMKKLPNDIFLIAYRTTPGEYEQRNISIENVSIEAEQTDSPHREEIRDE